jgi:hypothetical protein
MLHTCVTGNKVLRFKNGGDDLQIYRVLADIVNNGQLIRDGPPALGWAR